MVPVSKSSDDVVPPNGISRCVWTSMPPGNRYFPVASIVRSAGIVSDVPMAEIFSPSTNTSPLYLSVAVTIVPFLMSNVIESEYRPAPQVRTNRDDDRGRTARRDELL